MSQTLLTGFSVIKRDGKIVPAQREKIALAIQKAYLDVYKGEAGERMHSIVEAATEQVCAAISRGGPRAVHIEDIQDNVELALMRLGDMPLARGYMLFRALHAEKRKKALDEQPKTGVSVVINGVATVFDVAAMAAHLAARGKGLNIDPERIASEVEKGLYEGATEDRISELLRMTARSFIEQDPDYDRLVARLEIDNAYAEVLGGEVAIGDRATELGAAFRKLLTQGVDAGLLSPKLLQYDTDKLAAALDLSRDDLFDSLGIKTLYDRYFVHIDERRIEVPQSFFMRVAMGLALEEIDREERAIEFYNLLSKLDFLNSTPTLFNSGLVHSQLASCFLTTVGDDLASIYGDGVSQNAMLQKFAGGLGNDWTPVRALGAHIKGTNGKSQGVIPFLKVVNDTAVAVNQGGKRKGAVCAYLETWHLDIEAFLDLRKNTGDDRRRTHDMNTANWIPDLFMKRVLEKGSWTLFSPNDVPELHDLYGRAFEAKYCEYEAKARAGEIKLHTVVQANDLWRKMLTMLFETGHPWLTFKDPCNLRSPQQHVGVVHSSNLCTEITLNTSLDETAVCNIGSVNLLNHLRDGELDETKLRNTVRTAMRMLDNVIDLNFYTVPKARTSNKKHRPVGLGMMGFHDVLQKLRVPYASQEAVEFADLSAELLCYFAYEASADLAQERGSYSTFKGSLWSKGVMPLDSLDLLEKERGGNLSVDRSSRLGEGRWHELRQKVMRGMRNSNCVAIAPTATIGNIAGCSASIDPIYMNLSVKSNMSGEFTVINAQLVADLKRHGMWDLVMLADLKHFEGSLQRIERVPVELKKLYATAFEIEPQWLVEAAARRQKWIDMAQSLNLYMAGATGRKISDLYMLAWERGLKTTYYLRTLSASSAEKSTGRGGELNAVSTAPIEQPEPSGPVCTLRPGDPGFETCESCQ